MSNIIIKTEKNTFAEGEKDIIDYVNVDEASNLIEPSEAMKRESYIKELERNKKVSDMSSQKDIDPRQAKNINVEPEDQQIMFENEKKNNMFYF